MSYGSRTQYPRTSRTTRGGRGAQKTPAYAPRAMSNPGEEPGPLRTPQQPGGGDYDGEGGAYRGRRGSTGGPRERRMQRQDQAAHYVLAPDPSKNSKLKQGASTEELEYTRYKEEKRERVAQDLVQQPPATVGGVDRSLREIRDLREQQDKQQQNEARFAAVRSRKKREEYHRVQREKEDAKLDTMKNAQREKAVKAAARKEEDQRLEQEDTRRKRLAYFDPV